MPCLQGQDDILSWSPESWTLVGSQWTLTEEIEDQICVSSDFYNLAIPSEMTIEESMAMWKQKFNNSIIPFEGDGDSSIKYLVNK